MKIAIVCFNLKWQAGGVRLIFEEARALLRLGHRVIIYAPECDKSVYPDLEKSLEIKVPNPPIEINWQYKSNTILSRIFERLKRDRMILAVAKKLADFIDPDFDVVNVHDYAYIFPRFYRSKNPKAKFIWTMNEPPYMYLPKSNFFYDILSRFSNFIKDYTDKKYFRYIDVAVTLSSKNKPWAEKRGIRIESVWSGINFDFFYKPPRDISKRKRFYILGVGALNPYRRFEDIIKATKILCSWGYDVHTTIVCKNIWQQDVYREYLKKLVNDLEVNKNVKLLFDGATEPELRELYSENDFFILPLHLPPPRNGYGWQLVIFEAMAAGLVSVVSRKIDVTEALKDSENALFFDPESEMQIAEKVKYLIDNPREYYKIASSGQDFVKNNMSWDKYVKDLIKLLQT